MPDRDPIKAFIESYRDPSDDMDGDVTLTRGDLFRLLDALEAAVEELECSRDGVCFSDDLCTDCRTRAKVTAILEGRDA